VKIANLDIEIKATWGNPNRIREWPTIRHLLGIRFGEERSVPDLWKTCKRWLRAEGRVKPNEYLILPLSCLTWILESGFSSTRNGASLRELAALTAVQRQLDNWNASPSRTGYVVEKVSPGHPLHRAVDALQAFYRGRRLPRPALRHWKKFLRLTDSNDEEAEDEAEFLRKWVKRRIKARCARMNKFVGVEKRRGRKMASPETVRNEAELSAKWERARDAGTHKADFARDNHMTLKDLGRLLNRVAARKKRSDK